VVIWSFHTGGKVWLTFLLVSAKPVLDGCRSSPMKMRAGDRPVFQTRRIWRTIKNFKIRLVPNQ
jgi:hypothetical protein